VREASTAGGTSPGTRPQVPLWEKQAIQAKTDAEIRSRGMPPPARKSSTASLPAAHFSDRSGRFASKPVSVTVAASELDLVALRHYFEQTSQCSRSDVKSQ
jgi:hypothetical protein